MVKGFEIQTQQDAPRHLARLTQRDALTNSEDLDYYYDDAHDGLGVYAYVLDTGVLESHPQFEGRAQFGADLTGTGGQDVQGHGTHVAGIIASATFGVAKQATIVSVKVLDDTGTGTLSSVIEGIEFAVNHMHTHGQTAAVGNLSLGAPKNTVLNDAIRAAYSAGLVMVVAAGNSNMDACRDSPASSPYAITVGAMDDRLDQIATFSNWGECVDIFASGVYVESLYNRNVHSSMLMSGTSMSAPSVAGVVAILLSQDIRPADIAKHLYDSSTQEVFSSSSIRARPGTPNRLVYSEVYS